MLLIYNILFLIFLSVGCLYNVGLTAYSFSI